MFENPLIMTHILRLSQWMSVQTNEISVFNDPLSSWDYVLLPVAVHRFLKNLGATLKFCVREGLNGTSSILKTLQIWGATIQNLVTKVTWCPGFVHPWSKQVWSVNNELERIWKKLGWHLPGRIEENHEEASVRIAILWVKIWMQNLPGTQLQHSAWLCCVSVCLIILCPSVLN
jgi:hypothetical protein